MHSEELLKKYIESGLSKEERFLLEKSALEDDFLFEALEGLENNKTEWSSKSFERIRNRLKSEHNSKNSRIINIFPIAVAASLSLLIAFYYIFIVNRQTDIDTSLKNSSAFNSESESIPNPEFNLSSDASTHLTEREGPQAEAENRSGTKGTSTEKNTLVTTNAKATKSATPILEETTSELAVDIASDLASEEDNKVLSTDPVQSSEIDVSRIRSENPGVSSTMSLRSAQSFRDSIPYYPAIGYDGFRAMIEKERKIQKQDLFMRAIKSPAIVLLHFKTDEEGFPVDISVISSPSDFLNDEAIRLLRLSGKWINPDSEKFINCTIQF